MSVAKLFRTLLEFSSIFHIFEAEKTCQVFSGHISDVESYEAKSTS